MTTYKEDSEGKFIPATQRPDGTWRKARRVKEGYVPQEEVPLYESKGKQFAHRKSTLPPGMCPIAAEAAKRERERQERARAKKEAATKKQQEQQQAMPGILVLPTTATMNKTADVKDTPQNATAITMDKLAEDLTNTIKLESEADALDLARKLKKLRKKMREIESIEEKIKSGELKKPEKDQLDKVKRKKEIDREISQLEIHEWHSAVILNGGSV